MLEQKLWGRLQPKFKEWGTASRVENAIEPGTPDVWYVCSGQPNWVETKMVHNGVLHFEKFQIPWMRRYLAAGFKNLWVIAGFEDVSGTIYVYHAKEIVNAPNYIYRKWTCINIDDINPQTGLCKPYDWSEMQQLLSTQCIINT